VDSFGAVFTTGIYCRPGCGARPRAENRTTFQLAAAAEAAGFRACFQCRPYRWPQSISWTGSELVCRAVRLILAGALDRATEEQLGARLGVSARHLRRLFSAHLGVTPDGLARSARAHFARRLLDDSDLSIIEIALATGFGSSASSTAPAGKSSARRRVSSAPNDEGPTAWSPTAACLCGWAFAARSTGRP
jgi:AraC family transcriptional regulator of adaptative response / DNA-3-methyladenine glycosylase II